MSDTPPRNDSELAVAYRAGDTDAFAEIYDRNSATVFSYFLELGHSREDAAEATNEVFVEAADRFDAGETPTDSAEWLLGIAGAAVEAPPMAPETVVPAPPALRPRVLDKVEREVAAAFTAGAFTVDSLDPEWVRWGIFAVVTVVIGLLGFAVSARFEPLDPLPTVPVTEVPSGGVGSTTTTTPGGSSSTTDGAEPAASTSATTALAPAALGVSTETLDFGGDGTVNEFGITNSGGVPATFQVAVSNDAIALSAGQGEVAGGETVTIQMSLDRGEIEEGDIDETVTVTWDGGESEISITGSNEANPILHNPQASPSSVEVSGDDACTRIQTKVSVRVRDASPLASVVARWSPDGGAQRETEMSSVGNEMFEATIGPFTTVQTAEVRIVAFDDRGNAGGASIMVPVAACP